MKKLTKLTITIDTDNAAFQEPGMREIEVARILREFSDELFETTFADIGNRGYYLRDCNGNTCGEVIAE